MRDLRVRDFNDRDSVTSEMHDLSVSSDKIEASFGRIAKKLLPVAEEAIGSELRDIAFSSNDFGELLSVYFSAVLSNVVTIAQNSFANKIFDDVRTDISYKFADWFIDVAEKTREREAERTGVPAPTDKKSMIHWDLSDTIHDQLLRALVTIEYTVDGNLAREVTVASRDSLSDPWIYLLPSCLNPKDIKIVAWAGMPSIV